MKKRIISIISALALTLSLSVTALATSPGEAEAADELHAMGIFRGTGDGYALDDVATRQEAVAMTIRLLGKEETALKGVWKQPFTDVSPWAEGYVGYAYERGLASGYSATSFGGGEEVTVEQYLCFTLRALGYSEKNGDFSWSDPWPLAEKTGLVTPGSHERNEPCTRGAMALISANALNAALRGSGMTLGQYLEKAAADPAPLTATEIARKSTGAVFTLKTYLDTDYKIEAGQASGFFISADGVAVTNYHALDGFYSATVDTIAGETYKVLGIISANKDRDIVIMKVSMEALSGNKISKFPYLPLGRSALAETGDTVYNIGSPLGLPSTMTSGIVSNTYRNEGVQTYMQVSAATADGGSGGPILNDRGEVIGVSAAMYYYGDDMSLCVPIDVLMGMKKTGGFDSLYDYFSAANGTTRDLEATISLSKTSVTLPMDAVAEVLVTSQCRSKYYISYEIADEGVVYAQWGDPLSKDVNVLQIYGNVPGTTTIKVFYIGGYGNPDAAQEITVTVT